MSELPTPQSAAGGWTPPEVTELQALIAGYRIEDLLGRGGMGAVYRAEHEDLGRTVAIKLLPEYLTAGHGGDGNPDVHQFVERFKREARAMAGLDHPAIISVYDFGETSAGHLYFVMEYVDGMDIEQYISAAGGRIEAEHAVAIVSHVLDGLGYAHSMGIVHRDIKPANVLINREGKVKIADFGLAKQALVEDYDATLAAQLSLTNPDFAIGTPIYIAPEALTDRGEPDHRADLYAVGVMFYRMLTGKLPRGLFEPASEIVDGLNPCFDVVVVRAMADSPESRYQSANAFRAALDDIQTRPISRLHGGEAGTGAAAAVGRDLPHFPHEGASDGVDVGGRPVAPVESHWRTALVGALWVVCGLLTVVAIGTWLMFWGQSEPAGTGGDAKTATPNVEVVVSSGGEEGPGDPPSPIPDLPSDPSTPPSDAAGEADDKSLLTLIEPTKVRVGDLEYTSWLGELVELQMLDSKWPAWPPELMTEVLGDLDQVHRYFRKMRGEDLAAGGVERVVLRASSEIPGRDYGFADKKGVTKIAGGMLHGGIADFRDTRTLQPATVFVSVFRIVGRLTESRLTLRGAYAAPAKYGIHNAARRFLARLSLFGTSGK